MKIFKLVFFHFSYILRRPQIFPKSSHHVVPVKSKVKILQNFVAFSECMNFNWQPSRRNKFKSKPSSHKVRVNMCVGPFLWPFYALQATFLCILALPILREHSYFYALPFSRVIHFKNFKGQLISKSNFLVLICTKNQTKFFFDFCPKDLKWVKSKLGSN